LQIATLRENRLSFFLTGVFGRLRAYVARLQPRPAVFASSSFTRYSVLRHRLRPVKQSELCYLYQIAKYTRTGVHPQLMKTGATGQEPDLELYGAIIEDASGLGTTEGVRWHDRRGTQDDDRRSTRDRRRASGCYDLARALGRSCQSVDKSPVRSRFPLSRLYTCAHNGRGRTDSSPDRHHRSC